jgi:hypothetical protein
MTREQIEYALDQANESTGVWTTLEDSFKYITLSSDKNIYFNNPQGVQIYFSPTSDYFLIRYTRGKPTLYQSGDVPYGYVLVNHNLKQYLIKLESGGLVDASDDEAGLFHEIISFDSISGIHSR